MNQKFYRQASDRIVRLACAAGLALAISGCATSYPESTGAGSTNLANLTGAAALPVDVSSFLDSAAPGSVIAMSATSPPADVSVAS